MKQVRKSGTLKLLKSWFNAPLFLGKQMSVIKKLWLIILCYAFVGCAHDTAQKQDVSTGLKWTTDELQGATWELVDNYRIENMSFYANGYLPITLGVKTPTGSTIMAPVFHWSIDSEGALVITDTKNNIYEKLYKVEVDDRRVTVKLNGKIQVYDKLK